MISSVKKLNAQLDKFPKVKLNELSKVEFNELSIALQRLKRRNLNYKSRKKSLMLKMNKKNSKSSLKMRMKNKKKQPGEIKLEEYEIE